MSTIPAEIANRIVRMPSRAEVEEFLGGADLDVSYKVEFPPAFEGNRKARRKAAAQARKGVYVMPPVKYDPPRVSGNPAHTRDADLPAVGSFHG